MIHSRKDTRTRGNDLRAIGFSLPRPISLSQKQTRHIHQLPRADRRRADCRLHKTLETQRQALSDQRPYPGLCSYVVTGTLRDILLAYVLTSLLTPATACHFLHAPPPVSISLAFLLLSPLRPARLQLADPRLEAGSLSFSPPELVVLASGAGLEIPSQQALARANSKGRQGLWVQKDIHIVPRTPTGRHFTQQNLIESWSPFEQQPLSFPFNPGS